MKPIKISIKGFNSFIEEQTIDFEKLSSQGLFGIFGPTGSGKSTVLDALTFALYGKIAREASSHTQYINLNAESARVVLEFELSANPRERYKVIREIKKRKDKVQTSECKIIRLTNGEEVLAEKERETTEAIKKIIGLEYGDFVKTVVLPQGGFNDFLKMEGKDRREILERLFDLERYGKKLEMKISEQMKEVEMERSRLEGALAAYGEISEESVRVLEAELAELEASLKERQAKRDSQKKALEELNRIAELQDRLAAERSVLEKLRAKDESIRELERSLQRAEKADAIKPSADDYHTLVETGKKQREQLEREKKEYEVIKEELQIADLKYREVEALRRDEYPKLIERSAKLTQASESHQYFLKLQAETENGKKEATELARQIASHEKTIREIEEQLAIADAQIKEKEEYIRKISISAQERANLNAAGAIDQKIRHLGADIQALSMDIDQIGEVLQKEEAKEQSLRDRESALRRKTEELNAEREGILQHPLSDPLGFERRKNEIESRCKNAQQYKLYENESKQLEKASLALQAQTNELEERLSELQVEYDALRELQQTQLLHQSVHLLRKNLHTGDSCPVCGQTVLSDLAEKSEEEIDRNDLQAKIEAVEIRRQTLLAQRGQSEERLTSNQAERQRIAKLMQELGAVDEEEALRKRLEEETEIAAELRSKLLTLENALKELQEQKEHCGLEKATLQSKNEANRSRIENERKKLIALQVQQTIEKENLKALYPDEALSISNKLEQLRENEQRTEELRKETEQLKNQSEELTAGLKGITGKAERERAAHAALSAQIEHRSEALEREKQKILAVLGELIDPEPEIRRNEAAIRSIEKSFEEAKADKEEKEKREKERLLTLNALEQSIRDLRKNAREKQELLYQLLEKYGLASFEGMEDAEKLQSLAERLREAEQWLMSKAQKDDLERQINEHRQAISEKNGSILLISEQLGGKSVEAAELEEEEKRFRELNEQYEKNVETATLLKGRLEEGHLALEKIAGLTEEKKKNHDRFENLRELRSAVGAKKFVEFMALKQLRYITLKATERLLSISNGTYQLEVDEEGSFKIRDNKNGGSLRNVKTLSGGETFVVSLSLALALSERIQLKGTAPLELFFLDEGFGTLDEQLLEVVMDALERVQNENLKVGIISHVEQLKQRVPAKLLITPPKIGEGGSRVRIEYS